jgi:hypothetical protein
VKLDELSTIQNDLYHLFNLFQPTFVSVFYVGEKELEKILTHFVIDDGLASYFLLLHREFVKNS